MSIRAGTWKERNPGRSARRCEKRKVMNNLVLDYYTMNPGDFFDSAITFYNEFRSSPLFVHQVPVLLFGHIYINISEFEMVELVAT